MLSSYQDNELEIGEREEVEAHLKSCLICQKELGSFQHTSDLLQQITVISSRQPFTISENKTKRRFWDGRLIALSSSAILIAGLLLIVFIGDINHYFDAKGAIQYFDSPSQQSQAVVQTRKFLWPVKEAEFGLSIVFISILVYSVIYWVSRQRINNLEK